MMVRTLYLNESDRDIRVVMDGPSILIKDPERADRRIPLRFIGRVVIFGNIWISSDVLTALAGQNIPLICISKWASNISISMPFQFTYPAHCIDLELVLKDQQKAMDFTNWARQKRAFMKTEVIRRIYPNADISCSNYREIISFLMPEDREKWLTVKNTLKALFWSLITEHLISLGLDPHCGIINRKCAFGLVRDYAYIMSPEMDYQALQFFRSDSIDTLIRSDRKPCLLTAKGIHNIINRFENRQYIVRRLVGEIKDKLYELMGTDYEGKLSRLL